ncbi:hypothetical protein HDU67_002067 [Dinochytrium kinnereticum]|nr:hypothetical protein HDU67_002067 [Dinochytrium kinnereticum]
MIKVYTLHHVLHATDTLILLRVLSDEECWEVYEKDNDDEENCLERGLERLAGKMVGEFEEVVRREGAGWDGVVVVDVKVGNAKVVVCDVAREMNAHLLVVGKRGLGTIKKLMLGSVSDYVVKHATCPVLVVPVDTFVKRVEKEGEGLAV